MTGRNEKRAVQSRRPSLETNDFLETPRENQDPGLRPIDVLGLEALGTPLYLEFNLRAFL